LFSSYAAKLGLVLASCEHGVEGSLFKLLVGADLDGKVFISARHRVVRLLFVAAAILCRAIFFTVVALAAGMLDAACIDGDWRGSGVPLPEQRVVGRVLLHGGWVVGAISSISGALGAISDTLRQCKSGVRQLCGGSRVLWRRETGEPGVGGVGGRGVTGELRAGGS
jgi:hypothetical protein